MSDSMPTYEVKLHERLETAIELAGSVRALGRALNWSYSNLLRVRAGEKICPFRAGQVARFLGQPAVTGIALALMNASKSDAERAFWQMEFKAYLATPR